MTAVRGATVKTSWGKMIHEFFKLIIRWNLLLHTGFRAGQEAPVIKIQRLLQVSCLSAGTSWLGSTAPRHCRQSLLITQTCRLRILNHWQKLQRRNNIMVWIYPTVTNMSLILAPDHDWNGTWNRVMIPYNPPISSYILRPESHHFSFNPNTVMTCLCTPEMNSHFRVQFCALLLCVKLS